MNAFATLPAGPTCSREREPLGRPFRQAQGPEPVEGLGALTHSTPLRVILSLSNG